MQSAVKVGEESEVATNIQPYEIKRMSFTIKLALKNESAFTMLHTIYLVDTRGELEQSRCRQIGIKFVLNVPLRRLR